MIRRLNHVAMAVPNLQEACTFYRDVLQAGLGEIQELPEHGVRSVFVHLDNTVVELLEPLGDSSPLKSFLEKHPQGGIHHVCFDVADLNDSCAHVTDKNVRILGQPKIGAHGVPVVFLHPKDSMGCLIELQ